MATLSLLLTALVALGILGIAWWAITKMGLPQPLQIVAAVVLAMIAIILLLNLAHGHVSL